MALPKFIALKSDYNEKYLGYVPPEEFKDIDQGVARSRNSFLRFDRDEVSNTYTKFEVEPAKIGGGLVHLKSCHNNKYWVRWSPRHWWIVAAADQPEEDRSKWFCTLFNPDYIDRNANTVRFIHVQLGHFACLWRIGLPFGDCLYGGSDDPDQDSCDVVTVIDWESPSTSTSKPGGSDAAVDQDDDNSSRSVSASTHGADCPPEDQYDDNSTSLPRNSLKVIATLRGDHFNVEGTIPFIQSDGDSVTIITEIENIEHQFHALRIKTYGDISGGSASSGQTSRNLYPVDTTRTLQAHKRKTERKSLKAIATLKGGELNVEGTVSFSQEDPASVYIITEIENIKHRFHALHIKTYGDIYDGSASCGPTFRDLGNLKSDEKTGRLQAHQTSDEITLMRGEDSIIGRTIVVYSKSNPDPGVALAWGVIGYASE